MEEVILFMSLLTQQQSLLLISISMFFFYLFHLILNQLRRLHRRNFSGDNNNSPPTYPIIGCLISFYKNQCRLLDWYTDLLSNSPTLTIIVHRLGARRTIVTANPQNVEYILKTKFNNFPKGKPFTEILGDFLGCGIFNVDGELWHAQRKLASHEFSAKSLREFMMHILKEEVEGRLLPLLESKVNDEKEEEEEEVDMEELLRRLAFDMVCKVSLGIDPCCLDSSLPYSSLAGAFDMASEICAKRGSAPVFAIWKIKRVLRIGSERKLKNAVEEVHAEIEEIIKKKKKLMIDNERIVQENGNNVNRDLLSRLILAGLDEKVIRDMVISFIMAGRDTTSAAMTWLFWLLSCHPDIEEEIVKEIEEKCGHEKKKNESFLIDYESTEKMKLLKACLCESMRLYPPVAWDSKHAVTDDLLPDGTPVWRGDRVTYFPYGMGRMEALWGKDRLEFKPDRWFVEPGMEERERERFVLNKVCPYKFPVFQAGPRVCLGKEMAFLQMKYVVASILTRFEIRPVGSDRPVFVPLLTAHMAGGFRVSVRRRDLSKSKETH